MKVGQATAFICLFPVLEDFLVLFCFLFSSAFMFVALLPVNPVFVLLISCESLMKKEGVFN